MKHTLFIILLITILKPNVNAQSIDSIVNKRISDSVQALNNSLEVVKVVDRIVTGTVNIDTVVLPSNQPKIFCITFNSISGSIVGGNEIHTQIYNINGVYKVAYVTTISKLMGNITLAPTLINNNSMCVIQVRTGVLNPFVHYRRSEQ